jgi:hypothetical protein
MDLGAKIYKFMIDHKYSGIDFDLEYSYGDNPVPRGNTEVLRDIVRGIKKANAANTGSKQVKIVIAPQVNFEYLVSYGTYQMYKSLLENEYTDDKLIQEGYPEGNMVDYIFVQNYSSGFNVNPDYITMAFETATTASKGNRADDDPSAKIVIGYPATAKSAWENTSVYYYNTDVNNPLSTYSAMELVYGEISSKYAEMPDNFGGFMGWSINNDMVPATADKKTRTPGSYAMYMTPCAIYNRCSEIINNVDVGQEMTNIKVTNKATSAQGINKVSFLVSGSSKVDNTTWIAADQSSFIPAPVDTSVDVTITTGGGEDLECKDSINTKDVDNGVLTVEITAKQSGGGYDINCSYP